MHKHVRRRDAKAVDAGKQVYHCVQSFLRRLLQPGQTRLLDLVNLITDEAEVRHVALELVERVRWYRRTLRRAHLVNTFRRFA